MAKQVKIFKTFKEQEMYFLEYFFGLTPSERLKSLAALQKKNYPEFSLPAVKKITIRKHFLDDRI
jgi:hypothetical protein